MDYGNLKPTSQMEPEELAAFSRKGGIASGEARRRKRRIKQTLRTILADEYEPLEDERTGEVMGYRVDDRLYDLLALSPVDGRSDDEEQYMTNLDAMICKVFERAMTGNLSAVQLLLRLIDGIDDDGNVV